MSSVCVHGLGYIGLPTAAMLANYDHRVAGYDADPDVRSQLRNGDVHLDEPGLRAFVTQARESGNLQIVDEGVPASYHVICVPTPFDHETKQADLEYVKSAGRTVTALLQPGDTVVLESTVPPGTTTDVLAPILEESGLVAGADFSLVHCPETVLPGDIIAELRTNDRIIGGLTEPSIDAAVQLYEPFVTGEISTVKDPTVAEFVKLIQNTYRDVNIALANEIARLAGSYEINSRTAIALANGHPRVDLHQPGPGVGGHCLPIDPWFLDDGTDTLELIATARAVNDGMSGYVIELLCDALGSLEGRQIAVLGAAYKGNVDDTRNSPGVKLARELHAQGNPGLTVTVSDPLVSDPTLALTDITTATTDADAIVLTADHDVFYDLDPAALADRMRRPVIIDTKGMINRDEWGKAGFDVRQI